MGSFGGSLRVSGRRSGALVIKEAIRRGRSPAGCETPPSAPAVRTFFRDIDKTEIHKKYYDYPDTATPSISTSASWETFSRPGWDRTRGRQSTISRGSPRRRTPNRQQGLRLRHEGDRARRPVHQGRRHPEAVVAGGMENMSGALRPPDARWGYRMSMPFGKITDLVVFDGLYGHLQRLPHGVHGGEHRRPLRRINPPGAG